jgi:hypothetical protein
MTDFRALCVELAESGIGSHVDSANTSDEPAVSDDREPTSVVMESIT